MPVWQIDAVGIRFHMLWWYRTMVNYMSSAWMLLYEMVVNHMTTLVPEAGIYGMDK